MLIYLVITPYSEKKEMTYEPLIQYTHGVKTCVHTSIHDTIRESNNIIINEDRDDSSILSNFDDHITAIYRSTYFHIRNIGKIRNLLSYNNNNIQYLYSAL